MFVQSKSRIELLDLARGAALVAMAIYHFAWDLQFFGYIGPGTTEIGGWKLFARAIAWTFLFIVGVSLFLAHSRGIRWPAFLRRLGLIVAAALAISAVTWFAVPNGFIFFGILHQIALASLVGLAFLRLPAFVTLAAAAFAIAAPHWLRAPIFDHLALWWVGLSTFDPPSNDYVPLFPWFGAVLAGIAGARVASRIGLVQWLAAIEPGRWTAPLILAGRHSLLVYLLHQPVLIATVWAFAQVVPPQHQPPEENFVRACEVTCAESRSPEFCPLYCACVLDRLAAENRLDALFEGGQDAEMQSRLNEIARACTFETDMNLPQGGGDE